MSKSPSAGISSDNKSSKSVTTSPNTEETPTSTDTVMKSEASAVMTPAIETSNVGKDNRIPMLNIPVNVVKEYMANDKAKENGVSTNGIDGITKLMSPNNLNVESTVHAKAAKGPESMEVSNCNGSKNLLASSLISIDTMADNIDSVNNDTIKPLTPVTNESASYVPSSDLVELQTPPKSSNNEDKTFTQEINLNSSCKRPLSESSEGHVEKKKIKTSDASSNPLVMEEVLKLRETSSKLKRMKRKDLEKMVLGLFMEKFVHNHELGKYKELCESLESTLESNKKKCNRFYKEVS